MPAAERADCRSRRAFSKFLRHALPHHRIMMPVKYAAIAARQSVAGQELSWAQLKSRPIANPNIPPMSNSDFIKVQSKHCLADVLPALWQQKNHVKSPLNSRKLMSEDHFSRGFTKVAGNILPGAEMTDGVICA